jgi:hypothetical protein
MFSKKLTHLLAVGVTALFLGATSLHAQSVPPPPDADGDGVPDDVDECPNTDLSATTVVIDGFDTGIPNSEDVNEAGCSFADVINAMIDECALNAKNHGKFVRCVAHQTNALKRLKIITGKQKGKIQSIAARLPLP